MFIQPNSTIKLYTGVPLDNTYVHTLYFESPSDQLAYFHGTAQVVRTFSRQSYQRVVRGEMKVQVSADAIYNCNYLAFQNTSFGNKWFYAFITSVEYVNNETARVTFEIDVMQTYLFDVALEQSFVEREHTVSDNIGDNIQPEPVNTGELVSNDTNSKIVGNLFVDQVIILSYIDDGLKGNMYDGVFGAGTLKAYEPTDYDSLNQFLLANFITTPDNVLGLYMCPRAIIGSGEEIPVGGKIITTSHTGTTYRKISLGKVSSDDTLDGYEPRNNKLYTYPYNFCHVDNNSGKGLDLRYEFFEDNEAKCNIISNITEPVELVLYPTGYKGFKTQETNSPSYTSESLQVNNFPTCAWNVDGYQAWKAQNSFPMIVNAFGNLATGTLASGFTGKDMPWANQTLSVVTNALVQEYKASISADIIRGTFSNAGANYSNGLNLFSYWRMSVQRSYAKVIDNFFDVYGYSVREHKIPNRNARPHWTYTKTVNCNIQGNAPSDDITKLCSIYDNGITFWKNASEVGDYSLDNSPETT